MSDLVVNTSAREYLKLFDKFQRLYASNTFSWAEKRQIMERAEADGYSIAYRMRAYEQFKTNKGVTIIQDEPFVQDFYLRARMARDKALQSIDLEARLIKIGWYER